MSYAEAGRYGSFFHVQVLFMLRTMLLYEMMGIGGADALLCQLR